uniref:Integrase core domain containing protein n=1 Tax=Solanum tuberosum TaxID=4113 RepID=M1D970_SOLTU
MDQQHEASTHPRFVDGEPSMAPAMLPRSRPRGLVHGDGIYWFKLGIVVNHDVDYSPSFHQQTVLHIHGSRIREKKLGTLTYEGDPWAITPSTDRSYPPYHGSKRGTHLLHKKKVKVGCPPSHRVIHDSNGEEYTPGKRRAPPTAPLTTRSRNRQIVVSYEEHPSSTTPVVALQSKEATQNAEKSHSGSESQSDSSSSFTPASASDATSYGEAHDPMGIPMYPVLLSTEPNKWCVDGLFQIYYDGQNQNEQKRQTRTITDERWVLTGSLHTIPTIEELFKKHKCELMARSSRKFNEEMARGFYVSYAATVCNSISKRAKPIAQPPLQANLV